MHLVVVMPAYNEASVIGEVLASMPKHFSGIDKITTLVVDDCSTDNTREVVKSMGVCCISHEMNLGAGGATTTGLEAARELDADIVVTVDSDGQHSMTEIADLIAPIVNGEADFVLGSRLINVSKNMPLIKKFGNNLFNIVTYVFFGIWVTDSQSGFKALSKKALKDITISTTGFEFCSEMIGQIKKHHLKLAEVPISTIYTDYSKSKGQLALNGVNIIIALLLRKIH